jgi:hypothetical protein
MVAAVRFRLVTTFQLTYPVEACITPQCRAAPSHGPAQIHSSEQPLGRRLGTLAQGKICLGLSKPSASNSVFDEWVRRGGPVALASCRAHRDFRQMGHPSIGRSVAASCCRIFAIATLNIPCLPLPPSLTRKSTTPLSRSSPPGARLEPCAGEPPRKQSVIITAVRTLMQPRAGPNKRAAGASSAKRSSGPTRPRSRVAGGTSAGSGCFGSIRPSSVAAHDSALPVTRSFASLAYARRSVRTG